mmetsp:Transcript_22962/g.62302  ORF Transcript_22962/g.62302 Transcript_22962/m.62302 type:complete len:203 (+) Transcript_22962:942-1550(+)
MPSSWPWISCGSWSPAPHSSIGRQPCSPTSTAWAELCGHSRASPLPRHSAYSTTTCWGGRDPGDVTCRACRRTSTSSTLLATARVGMTGQSRSPRTKSRARRRRAGSISRSTSASWCSACFASASPIESPRPCSASVSAPRPSCSTRGFPSSASPCPTSYRGKLGSKCRAPCPASFATQRPCSERLPLRAAVASLSTPRKSA